MTICLKRVSYQNVDEELEDLVMYLELLDDRLQIPLWENPQWLRNRLVMGRVAVVRRINKLTKFKGQSNE